MGAMFGRYHFGNPVPSDDLMERAARHLRRAATGHQETYVGAGLSLAWQGQFENGGEEDPQPVVLPSGIVVAFDGRLDNEYELQRDLGLSSARTSSIVGAAYEQWGPEALGRFIGDWALSIFDPSRRFVILARDFLGIRPLFYLTEADEVIWSTTLEAVVLTAKRRFSLEEEYLAGWLSSFPAAHLTPYSEIRAVPPASFATFQQHKSAVRQYWFFDPQKVMYRKDSDYEEHYRSLLAQAVRRRLKSPFPVLAELSGGIDSASIVCMADRISAEEPASVPRVDTVSYFSNSEPHWNEEPYFTLVEEHRGRFGLHISVDHLESGVDDKSPLLVLPGRGSRTNPQLSRSIDRKGYRVLLSGVGGDEFNGGAPSPLPELQDLLTGLRLIEFTRKLGRWALIERRPWHHLLAESLRPFASTTIETLPFHRQPGRWIRRDFIARNSAAFLNYESRTRFLGSRPSFQENLFALEAIRRQISATPESSDPRLEKRYPYLDRSLLEFLFAIPREQLVRPGQRRSLMRRALKSIVPEPILNRRRKAYVTRAMQRDISARYRRLMEAFSKPVTGELGMIDPEPFLDALRRVDSGQELPGIAFMRSVGIEGWLQPLRRAGVLEGRRFDFSRFPCPQPGVES